MEQLKAVDLIRPSLDWSVIRESNVGNDEAFFSHHFRELVNDISAMAGHAFRADKPLGDQDPWVNEFPAEFYEFVNTVAHPDPRAGDWENLLRVEYERTAFVGAVILKAIDEHVLSKMMFGADDNHEQALRLGDDALLRNDGENRP